MIYIDDVKLERLTEVPSTPKQVGFKLHPSQMPINVKTKKPTIPRTRTIEPFFNYYNPETKQSSTMRYATNQTPKQRGGVTHMEYYPSFVAFPQSGLIFVDTARQPDLYMFLTLHPRNADSKYADSTKQPIFYMEDQEKEAREKNRSRKERSRYENKIFEIWSDDELKEMCRALAIPVPNGTGKEYMQNQLAEYLQRDLAKFSEMAEDADVGLRARIVEGQSLNIIRYDEKSKAWFYVGKTADLDSEITSVMGAEDPIDRLINYWKRTNAQDGIPYCESVLAERKNSKGKKPVKKAAVETA